MSEDAAICTPCVPVGDPYADGLVSEPCVPVPTDYVPPAPLSGDAAAVSARDAASANSQKAKQQGVQQQQQQKQDGVQQQQQQKQKPKGPAGALDCPLCFEAFAVAEAHHPRMVIPCACTFCTRCVGERMQHQRFHCPTHPQHSVPLVCAEDMASNGALLSLLERVQKDEDHKAVDERTPPPVCSECEAPGADFFCAECNACFCVADKERLHSFKALREHRVVPVSERNFPRPKCDAHSGNVLDLWCTKCSALCCHLCRDDAHNDHAKEVKQVDSIVTEHRTLLKQLAAPLSADAIAPFNAAAKKLLDERAAFERALAQRMGELTDCNARVAMVREEARRVLKMHDYAVLKHTRNAKRTARVAAEAVERFKEQSLQPMSGWLLAHAPQEQPQQQQPQQNDKNKEKRKSNKKNKEKGEDKGKNDEAERVDDGDEEDPLALLPANAAQAAALAEANRILTARCKQLEKEVEEWKKKQQSPPVAAASAMPPAPLIAAPVAAAAAAAAAAPRPAAAAVVPPPQARPVTAADVKDAAAAANRPQTAPPKKGQPQPAAQLNKPAAAVKPQKPSVAPAVREPTTPAGKGHVWLLLADHSEEAAKLPATEIISVEQFDANGLPYNPPVFKRFVRKLQPILSPINFKGSTVLFHLNKMKAAGSVTATKPGELADGDDHDSDGSYSGSQTSTEDDGDEFSQSHKSTVSGSRRLHHLKRIVSATLEAAAVQAESMHAHASQASEHAVQSAMSKLTLDQVKHSAADAQRAAEREWLQNQLAQSASNEEEERRLAALRRGSLLHSPSGAAMGSSPWVDESEVEVEGQSFDVDSFRRGMLADTKRLLSALEKSHHDKTHKRLVEQLNAEREMLKQQQQTFRKRGV